jgi:hypothetical protein
MGAGFLILLVARSIAALAAVIAFSLRSSAGNGATWLLVAGFGLAAAALGAAAAGRGAIT